MEGGIAILLLLIIVVVAAVIGIALYLTGGALWFGKTSPKGDKVEGSDTDRFDRPENKPVTSETIENTHVVGTRDDER
jgi:flagellar basal body-associated protein FliL